MVLKLYQEKNAKGEIIFSTQENSDWYRFRQPQASIIGKLPRPAYKALKHLAVPDCPKAQALMRKYPSSTEEELSIDESSPPQRKSMSRVRNAIRREKASP